MAVAIGFLLGPLSAPVAQAYSGSDCAANPVNVYDVDRFKVGSTPVYFGDGSIQNGILTDYAVTCWTSGRTVQLKGKLFLDPSKGFRGCIRAAIRYLDKNGNVIRSADSNKDLCNGAGSNPNPATVDQTVPGADRVYVYAYKKSSTSDSGWVLVGSASTRYGPD